MVEVNAHSFLLPVPFHTDFKAQKHIVWWAPSTFSINKEWHPLLSGDKMQSQKMSAPSWLTPIWCSLIACHRVLFNSFPFCFFWFSASSPLSLLLVCSLLKMTKNHFAMSWGKGEKLSKKNKSLWDSKAWMPCSQPDLLWNVTAVQNCNRNIFLWDQLLEHSVSKTF